MSGQRPRGQRGAAQSSGSGGSASRAAQPQQPNPAQIVAEVAPIMEAYGYTEAEIIALVKRCNYDQAAIQAAVSHILEEREGHEQGDWETTDTAETKKEKQASAKERKAQKEKERLEEEEREKQRREERREEEKKRHLELAARRKALEEEKKNKPGSALVQKAAPWRPTAQDAAAEKDGVAVPSNGYAQGAEDPTQEPEVAVQEDYPVEDESPVDETQEQVSSSWAQPSYDAAETPADEQYPVGGQIYAAPATSDYVMSAPPGVPPILDPASTWSAPPMAGWDGNGGAVAAGASQAAPWTSSWSADGGAWNDQTSATVNGKSQWVVTPVVSRLADDTVTMPSSFWDLLGGGPIPEVPFGSLLLEAQPPAEPVDPEGDVRGTYHEAQEAAGEEKPQQDDARTPPREKAQYADRRSGGGKKGGRKGTYRPREEKAEKGDAGADDGKGKSSRKGTARGKGGDREGPGGSSGKGKGWRSEKGDKGERQKGGSKTASQ